jgi:hypothetical protein
MTIDDVHFIFDWLMISSDYENEWKVLSSGIQRREVSWKSASIYDKHLASIFRIE